MQEALRRQTAEQPPVEQRPHDPARRRDRSQNADLALGEFQFVRHGVIERRAQPGTEVIEKEKKPDHPQLAFLERGDEAGEAAVERRHVEANPLLGNEEDRAEQDRERRRRYDRRGGMQSRGRRQPLRQRAAADGAGHGGDVEPQPLLIDEPAALAEPLPVLHQHGSTPCSISPWHRP